MENLIESRVILGLLCLIHIFANYAGANGAVYGHINKGVLNGLIGAELLVVTAYIVYDNLCVPPYDGWTTAILGYFFVYGLICLTWLVFRIYTLLEEDKIYEMIVSARVRFKNKDYFKGMVIEGEHEVEVFLPCSLQSESTIKAGKKPRVKFAEVLRGLHILVKPA